MPAARFDPTQTYSTVTDIEGNVFAFQNSLYYDKYGNSWTSVPKSRSGWAGPTAPSTGGGTFATLTGNATDNASLLAQLNLRLNNALSWDGTTPNLQSGVSPVIPFGSNVFVYTGAGGAVLDTQTYATNDLAIWNLGGTSTFTKVSTGGAYLGVFASTGALPTASTNLAAFAAVGGAAPYLFYTSNGSAWVQELTSAQLAVASGIATLDGSAHLLAAQVPAFTGDVTIAAGGTVTVLPASTPVLNQQTTNAQVGTTYTFVLADAGQNVDMTNASAITATIPPHSSVAYPVGTYLYWTQGGAGGVTLAPGAAVTFTKRASFSLSTAEALATGYAYQISQDNWRIYNT